MSVLGKIASTMDGFVNFVTNLGTDGDKGMYSRFIKRNLTCETLTALYMCGGIGGKIVDVVPDDAIRKWRRVIFPDKFNRDPFDESEESMNVVASIALLGKWARLYGGGIIIPVLTGAAEKTEEPLNINTISPNNPIVELRVLSRHEVMPTRFSERTGRATEFSDMYDGDKRYHASRVIGPLDGITLPIKEMQLSQGWGGSVIERCYDSLLSKKAAGAQIAPLIHEALTKIVEVENLDAKLDGKEIQARYEQRWRAGQLMASSQNVFLLNKGEEELKTTGSASATAGLAELMRAFGQELAGECDIPMTRLSGESPGGLNSNGEGSLKDYKSMIVAYQKYSLGPVLRKLDALLMRSVYGSEPAGWWYEWNPIDDPTEEEKANLNHKKIQTDEIAARIGAIKPAHATMRINNDGPYEVSEEFMKAAQERDGLITTKNEPENVTAGAGAGDDLQSKVLNGAQISSLIEIAKGVKLGEISAESAIAIVRVSVPTLTEEQAKDIVGEYDEEVAREAKEQKEKVPNGIQETEAAEKVKPPVDETETE